jgi:hypothetical protein
MVQPRQDRIALNFLPLGVSDFSFHVYRRPLLAGETATSQRWLPEDIADPHASSNPGRFYEISFEARPDHEAVRVGAWVNPQLTLDVIHRALLKRVQQADLKASTEVPQKAWKRKVAFLLDEHKEGVREVMWVRPYDLKSIARFGFLLKFALRVPPAATITTRRVLELGLTHKRGRTNEDFYLDQYEKINTFMKFYYKAVATFSLHDGTAVDVESRLALVPSFPLDTRTYVFAGDREGKNQFFGLRDYGPYAPANSKTRLAFLFRPEDRPSAQDLFRALRGDVFATFPGMHRMFGVAIRRENATGVELASFTREDVQNACRALKRQYQDDVVLPIALVPFSQHVSAEVSLDYYRAKHAILTEGLASQFVDRAKTMGNRETLKWSLSNIALGIFAKMGGVPWRIKPSTEKCLVVGIGQAHRVVERTVERYVAYSVLTDSSGSYEAIKVLGNSTDHDQYIASLKTNLRGILQSHDDRYASFVIHATFSLRKDDIQAIKDLLREVRAQRLVDGEFVVVKFNDVNDFFGFSVDHNSRIPYEGAVARLSKRQFVVWFSGLNQRDSKVPRKPERPVHVQVLYPDEPLTVADLQRLLQDAINIAGANWRGFNAKSMPISVYYAKLIADHYAHFREAGLADIDLEGLPPWFL